MKVILELDGFRKFLEVKDPNIFLVETIHMDDQTLEIPFVRIGQQELDGEEVAIYKVVEPKKDGAQ